MKQKTINKIINIALTFNLSKQQTIKLIENIFTDPSQAPGAINVNFVKDNLDDIIIQINTLNKNQFKIYNYTNEMLNINTHNDIVLYVENIDHLLININEKIKIKQFKCVYENNILYLKNFNYLKENNKDIIIEYLKSKNAINITNKIKINKKINNL